MKKKERNEEDSSNNSTTSKIIRFTLSIIIIVIILFLHSCFNIGTVNDFVPTGNIDIFDITIDKSCCNDNTTCECNCNKDENGTNSNKKHKDVEKDEPIEEIKDARILDSDGKYNSSADLRIFSNPAYELREVIAPTSTNVYQFVVRNSNDFNIKYSLVMNEVNKHNINMKYRMKKDGVYVAGNSSEWVKYNELGLRDLELNSNSKNVYQLEWKWFESNNDTYVGTIESSYALKISFDGEEI